MKNLNCFNENIFLQNSLCHNEHENGKNEVLKKIAERSVDIEISLVLVCSSSSQYLNCFIFAGIGAKCHYDSHCIENAFCRHQLVCFCKKDYWMMSDDHWKCKGEIFKNVSWETIFSFNFKFALKESWITTLPLRSSQWNETLRYDFYNCHLARSHKIVVSKLKCIVKFSLIKLCEVIYKKRKHQKRPSVYFAECIAFSVPTHLREILLLFYDYCYFLFIFLAFSLSSPIFFTAFAHFLHLFENSANERNVQ